MRQEGVFPPLFIIIKNCRHFEQYPAGRIPGLTLHCACGYTDMDITKEEN